MTLTDALRAALDPATHASNLTSLRQLAAQDKPDGDRAARQALLAHVFLAGLDRSHLGGRFPSAAPAILFTLISGGADLDDLRLVTMEPAIAPEIPRSAEWVSAAERLAAWADGQVEPAPWDDPTAMSYEEIGDLVGL